MTEEEKKLSSEDLQASLKGTRGSANQENNVKEGAKDTDEHVISGNGISGKYKIVDKEDGGYELNQRFVISSFRNQAATVFTKEYRESFGLVDFKPDKEGYYHYRGLKSRNYNILTQMIRQASQQIAGLTGIYNDLCTRQKNGEALSQGEQKFMEDFHKNLSKHGLQINNNGELENIN